MDVLAQTPPHLPTYVIKNETAEPDLKQQLVEEVKVQKPVITDPLPTLLKQYFYQEVEQPHILSDYDVIGFDVDHCLVKYKIPELVQEAAQTYLKDFVKNYGYPEEILKFQKKDLETYQNGVVWDIKNGALLKMTEGRRVTHCVQGYDTLNMEQQIELYGYPPLFRHVQWPEKIKSMEKEEGAYWVLANRFDSILVPIIAQLMHCAQYKIITKTNLQIAFDLLEVHSKQLEALNSPKSKSYLQRVLVDPQRFLVKQPQVLELLKKLKDNNKTVFMLSNSSNEWVKQVMTASLGPEWKLLFDLCIVNARKPLFQKTESPFTTLDGSKISNLAALETSIQNQQNVFQGGNAELLTQYFQSKVREDVTVAYFSSKFSEDIWATKQYDNQLLNQGKKAKWDSITIVEEINYLTEHQNDKQNFPQNEEFWGKYYFWNEIKYGFPEWLYTEPKNFFITEMEACSRYFVPQLKDAIHLVTKKPAKEFPALPHEFKHSDSEDETTEEFIREAYRVPVEQNQTDEDSSEQKQKVKIQKRTQEEGSSAIKVPDQIHFGFTSDEAEQSDTKYRKTSKKFTQEGGEKAVEQKMNYARSESKSDESEDKESDQSTQQKHHSGIDRLAKIVAKNKKRIKKKPGLKMPEKTVVAEDTSSEVDSFVEFIGFGKNQSKDIVELSDKYDSDYNYVKRQEEESSSWADYGFKNGVSRIPSEDEEKEMLEEAEKIDTDNIVKPNDRRIHSERFKSESEEIVNERANANSESQSSGFISQSEAKAKSKERGKSSTERDSSAASEPRRERQESENIKEEKSDFNFTSSDESQKQVKKPTKKGQKPQVKQKNKRIESQDESRSQSQKKSRSQSWKASISEDSSVPVEDNNKYLQESDFSEKSSVEEKPIHKTKKSRASNKRDKKDKRRKQVEVSISDSSKSLQSQRSASQGEKDESDWGFTDSEKQEKPKQKKKNKKREEAPQISRSSSMMRSKSKSESFVPELAKRKQKQDRFTSQSLLKTKQQKNRLTSRKQRESINQNTMNDIVNQFSSQARSRSKISKVKKPVKKTNLSESKSKSSASPSVDKKPVKKPKKRHIGMKLGCAPTEKEPQSENDSSQDFVERTKAENNLSKNVSKERSKSKSASQIASKNKRSDAKDIIEKSPIMSMSKSISQQKQEQNQEQKSDQSVKKSEDNYSFSDESIDQGYENSNISEQEQEQQSRNQSQSKSKSPSMPQQKSKSKSESMVASSMSKNISKSVQRSKPRQKVKSKKKRVSKELSLSLSNSPSPETQKFPSRKKKKSASIQQQIEESEQESCPYLSVNDQNSNVEERGQRQRQNSGSEMSYQSSELSESHSQRKPSKNAQKVNKQIEEKMMGEQSSSYHFSRAMSQTKPIPEESSGPRQKSENEESSSPQEEDDESGSELQMPSTRSVSKERKTINEIQDEYSSNVLTSPPKVKDLIKPPAKKKPKKKGQKSCSSRISAHSSDFNFSPSESSNYEEIKRKPRSVAKKTQKLRKQNKLKPMSLNDEELADSHQMNSVDWSEEINSDSNSAESAQPKRLRRNLGMVISECDHQKNLLQHSEDQIKQIEHMSIAACEDCDFNKDLFMCMTCGHLACKSSLNHSERHFKEHDHALAIQMNSLNSFGKANIFCYECGKNVKDLKLKKHLKKLGVNISKLHKNLKEKNQMALEPDQQKMILSETINQNCQIQPVFGQNLTGIENSGNSSYLSVLLQALSSFSQFQKYYGDTKTKYFENNFNGQFKKIITDLSSGEYSQKDKQNLNGISVETLRQILKDENQNPDSQQDVKEYFPFLLKKLQDHEKYQKPKNLFEFELEHRTECQECQHVRIRKSKDTQLLVDIAKNQFQVSGGHQPWLTVDELQGLGTHTQEWEVDVTDDQQVSFSRCLATFLEQKFVHNVKCQKCKQKTLHTQKNSFLTFPKVLTVVINRFVVDNWVPRKIKSSIVIPNALKADFSLDFEHFKSQEEPEKFQDDTIYEKPQGQDTEVQVDMKMVKELMNNNCTLNGAKHAVYRAGRKGFPHALEWYYLNEDNKEIHEKAPVKTDFKPPPAKKLEQMTEDLDFTVQQAKRGLRKCNNNVTAAAYWIVEHLDETDTEEYENKHAQKFSLPQEKPAFEEATKENGNYLLSSFVTHLGETIEGGHYVYHARKENKWIQFDDKKVTSTDNPPIGEGYMYFFEKI